MLPLAAKWYRCGCIQKPCGNYQTAFIYLTWYFLVAIITNKWMGERFCRNYQNMPVLKMQQCSNNYKQLLVDYMKNKKLLNELIQRNAMIKIKVVQKDEFEKRRPTFIELWPHTQSCCGNTVRADHMDGLFPSEWLMPVIFLSSFTGFSQTEQIVSLLGQYNLPSYASFDKRKFSKSFENG